MYCMSYVDNAHDAGEPCVEQLARFDAVQTEQDYKQEVQRWTQQVGRHDIPVTQ